MKRIFRISMLLIMCSMMGLVSCNTNPEPTPDPDQDKPVENKELTSEETKEKLADIANRMIATFNTADQKAAIELADGLYYKFENYDWGAFDDHFDNKYSEIFRLPAYAKAVTLGRKAPTAVDYRSYIFSFEGESVVFEADDNTKSWVNKGKASDNTIVLRFKDKNGTQCEAKLTGEGANDTYEFSWREEEGYWEEHRYDEPYYCDEYYGDCYYDYWWEYVKTGETNYDIKAVVPKKLTFTLTQGTTTVINIVVEQDLKKNDHITTKVNATVANLSWTADINLKSTNASAAFAFRYGNKDLISAMVNLPSFTLINKTGGNDIEDWENYAEQYADRYDELLRKIGSADAIVDVMGEMQLKGNLNNFGYAYRDYMKWGENYENYDKKERCDKLCAIINDNQSNGIYYNSDIKQAEVIVQSKRDEWEYYDWETGTYRTNYDYDPEPVLYFKKDGTTYAFEEYFDRKPFTNLQYSVEDLINAYIHLSKFLSDEVMDGEDLTF